LAEGPLADFRGAARQSMEYDWDDKELLRYDDPAGPIPHDHYGKNRYIAKRCLPVRRLAKTQPCYTRLYSVSC